VDIRSRRIGSIINSKEILIKIAKECIENNILYEPDDTPELETSNISEELLSELADHLDKIWKFLYGFAGKTTDDGGEGVIRLRFTAGNSKDSYTQDYDWIFWNHDDDWDLDKDDWDFQFGNSFLFVKRDSSKIWSYTNTRGDFDEDDYGIEDIGRTPNDDRSDSMNPNSHRYNP